MLSGNEVLKCNICPLGCELKANTYGRCGIVKYDPSKGIVNMHKKRGLFASVSPIESIPLYHFYPGAIVLTLWLVGCPLKCDVCPYKALAGSVHDSSLRILDYNLILDLKDRQKAKVLMIGCGEIGVHVDWILEFLKIAKSKNIPIAVRSLGIIRQDKLEELTRSVDAVLLELLTPLLKHSNTTVDVDIVLPVYEKILNSNVHVEIMIPYTGRYTIKDYENDPILGLVRHIDPEVPIHLISYVEVELHRLYGVRSKLVSLGFKNVYIPKDPILKYTNTYCPNCRRLVIERDEVKLVRTLLDEGEITMNKWRIRRKFMLEEIVW